MTKNRPIVHRLPDEYLLLIGESVSAWAVVEYELKATVYMMLDVGPKRGRVAVRSPRASEIVDMIGELLAIDGLTSKVIDLKKFSNLLDEIDRRRNTLAHNVWMTGDDGRLFVQSLAGTWPTVPGKTKTTRRIEPAGIPIARENLDDLVSVIRKVLAETVALRVDIAAQLAALPKTHREQVDPTNSQFAPNESPKPQQPPYQE